MKKQTVKKNAYAGIPANMRKKIIAIMEIDRGIGRTPREVYGLIVQHQKEQAEEKEREARERSERNRQETIDTLTDAISKLSEARDVAYAIERGDKFTGYFDPQSLGMFARLAITEAGSELEQALCNLGLIPAQPKVGGFFVNELKRYGAHPAAIEKAQEASHG